MRLLALALLLIPAFGFSQFRTSLAVNPFATPKQEFEKKAYRPKSAIFPAAFGVLAGVAPNTSWGRAVKDGSLYGCAISITIGQRKPIEHYFFNACISGAGFLAGRGIRAIADSNQ